jgi:ATP-dependent helicase/nuclease subunit B
LADDLARLIDDVITREVDWKSSTSWCRTSSINIGSSLDFLKIARSYWPERLAEIGAIDASRRRDLLIEAEMKPRGQP